MDLYCKKNKISNLVAQRLREKYNEAQSKPPKRYFRNETFAPS